MRQRSGLGRKLTAAVLLIILISRIFATRFEERNFHSIYGPRKTDVARLVQIVLRDGPSRQRVMCYFAVLAQILLVTCAEKEGSTWWRASRSRRRDGGVLMSIMMPCYLTTCTDALY